MTDLEQEIREAVARGDQRAAATRLIQEYGPELRAFLVRVLHGDDAGDEAFSRACEELWRGLPRFRGESSVRAWAYRVAWCTAMRWWRDPFRRRGRRLLTSELSRLVASISSQRLERNARERALEALRGELAPEEQALLSLRLDRELSWEEVAEVLAEEGQPATAAALRKRFERLKEKLGRLARAHGLVEGGSGP